MTTPRPRTLEELRQDASPAWLWDAARGRIVWANAAGVQALGGDSVFDLVDRPFDTHDPAVLGIRQLAATLPAGQVQSLRMALPGAGGDMAVQCSLHLLADGRQGLLIVSEPPPKPLTPITADVANTALTHLPVAVLVCDMAGNILHGNEAAQDMLDLAGTRALATFVQPVDKAEALFAGLQKSAVASAVLSMACKLGQREVRVTLSRLPASALPRASAILEDVTDRRALERSLQGVTPPPGPVLQAPHDAFALLAKSLQDTIEAQSAKPAVAKSAAAVPPASVQQPAPAATHQHAPSHPAQAPHGHAANGEGHGKAKPHKLPFVPQPVRQSFERMGEAILIGRGDLFLFATSKAAHLLGYESPESLLTDGGLWSHFRAMTDGHTSLPLLSGASIDLDVTHASVPWVNGPAEQIMLRRAAGQAPAAKKAAAPPEPQIQAVTPPPAAATPEPAPAPAAAPVAATPAPPAAAPPSQQVMATSELKAMLDVASDGIIALDADGVILSFSAGAEAIFGMTQEEVQGRPFSDILTSDGRKPWRDYLAALRGPGLASVFNDGREFTAIVKQGGTVPLFVTLGRLQSPHSQASFCAVVRDITQWKRTEQELREAKEAAELASRQKSEFLAGISHEIRTPLNAILGFSDVMRTERFGELRNEKYRAYANDIHASGTHLLALVNDLLDLSKVEAGKLELDFTAVNVVEAVEHVLRLMSEEAARSNVVVRKSFAPGLPRVVADLRALRQVLLNLISNAIKYTDAGGQVIVSALMENSGEVVLRVKDSGIGMSPAQLQEVLQPYARVESAGRTRQGTGLGLPLSKALAEANRAQFSIASEPGQGTLAEVRFPATRVLAE